MVAGWGMADPAPVFGRAKPRGPIPVPPRRRLDEPQAPMLTAEDPLDAELAAWKAARPRRPFPWRQVWLIGGLCFGAGSLVLPDSVNDAARYFLYAIAAIGFFGGLAHKRRKPAADQAS